MSSVIHTENITLELMKSASSMGRQFLTRFYYAFCGSPLLQQKQIDSIMISLKTCRSGTPKIRDMSGEVEMDCIMQDRGTEKQRMESGSGSGRRERDERWSEEGK